MRIAIFYHCLFALDRPDNVLPMACSVVEDQMYSLKHSGLLEAASHFVVGINGGKESECLSDLFIPKKANRVFHGLQCRNENRTLLELERWLPGHQDWFVLYFHAKGSIGKTTTYEQSTKWRNCMMRNVVHQWRRCVIDLSNGYESVGCHWMTFPKTPKGQSIWAGTFFWSTAAFLSTLPSITRRAQIMRAGIDHSDSRYETEVWIGNGPRLPRVRDYHPNWDPSKISTCDPGVV